MTSRRFDTDEVLAKVLQGDIGAFSSFSERYRGRVYRYIIRQYGNNEQGKSVYFASWAHLATACRESESNKDLKLSFFRFLTSNPHCLVDKGLERAVPNYLPTNLEEDSKWAVTLVGLVKRLPEDLRKQFLFRYEIGLSNTAISKVMGSNATSVKKAIARAEQKIRAGLEMADCPETISLDSLYRESRTLKPPSGWDYEVIESYPKWLKNKELPVIREQYQEAPSKPVGFGGMLSSIKGMMGVKERTIS